LLLASCAAALTAASIVASATPADAHHRRHYRACVTAEHGAWLHPHWCYGYHCWEPVSPGRAFRVKRQRGPHLLVWNQTMIGWVNHDYLSIATQDYCRAAGI
jgi:hypothetical protein